MTSLIEEDEDTKITQAQIDQFIKYNKCPKCNATRNIIKSGFRYNVGNIMQNFKCKNGGHFFCIDTDKLGDLYRVNEV